MTLTQRIKRLQELRDHGIDWSEMDRAMYGALPTDRRVPAWLRRQSVKDMTGKVVA